MFTFYIANIPSQMFYKTLCYSKLIFSQKNDNSVEAVVVVGGGGAVVVTTNQIDFGTLD